MNIIPLPNKIKLQSGMADVNDLSVSRALSPSLAEEAYILQISEAGVMMQGGSERALYYAGLSFAQLVFAGKGKVPFVQIEDAPRFPYRAFMIDCARHFFPVPALKKMIDAASLFKFNVFHWHLTDDQGWRIESARYPKLVEIGSVRSGSHFGRTHDETPYAAYYTKKQVREIVEYCKSKQIEVVPEIEMPGHASAWLSAYPEISCKGVPVEAKQKQGIFEDLLCAGNEKTYEMVYGVLDEVCELFPESAYIHIGGDEAPKTNWAACPRCKAKLQVLGLEDPEQLHGYFMNQVAAHLKMRGKQVITWNESLRGGNLTKDAAVQIWKDGKKDGAAFANSGGRIIVSNFFHYYMDYPYEMTPLKKVYGFDPALKDLDANGTAQVMGVDSPIWTEHIRTLDELSQNCFPRWLAVAERAWTQTAFASYPEFVSRVRLLLPLVEGCGLKTMPEQDWAPNLLKRAGGTAGFFRKTQTVESVRDFIKPKPKGE